MPPKHMHRATANRMRSLDLFSGIGSFSLALDALGCSTVGYCDADEGSRAVLRARMAEGRLHQAPIFDDVRKVGRRHLVRLAVDAICAGFPCVDLSSLGPRAGLQSTSERSGLFWEVVRLCLMRV